MHFDAQPSISVAESIATDPNQVASHAFYPFLGFTITTPKVKRDGRQFVKKDKKRPIKLAAHLDAAIYGHYARLISSCYEAEVMKAGIGSSVTAFRSSHGKNNIHFAHEVFSFIDNNRPCVVIGLDVEKFFDRLDHCTLKQRWGECIGETRLPSDHFNVFKSLTDFTWVDRNRAYRAVGISPHNPRPASRRRHRLCSAKQFRENIRAAGLVWKNPEIHSHRGIPQGAPISALLSNVYMLEFDKVMNMNVNQAGGLYRRYCDDIIAIVPVACAERIESLAMTTIDRLRLNINPDKTVRASFPVGCGSCADDGKAIQYLGFDYNGSKRLIRAGSLGRYYGKMRKGVSLAKQTQRKYNGKETKEGRPLSILKTRKLYIRYSYLIKRRFSSIKSGGTRQNENFITYAHRAALIMNAPEIKHQVRGHLRKLRAEVRKAMQ
jgi:hypothetical protein